jgi:hypothetical protein
MEVIQDCMSSIAKILSARPVSDSGLGAHCNDQGLTPSHPVVILSRRFNFTVVACGANFIHLPPNWSGTYTSSGIHWL